MSVRATLSRLELTESALVALSMRRQLSVRLAVMFSSKPSASTSERSKSPPENTGTDDSGTKPAVTNAAVIRSCGWRTLTPKALALA